VRDMQSRQVSALEKLGQGHRTADSEDPSDLCGLDLFWAPKQGQGGGRFAINFVAARKKANNAFRGARQDRHGISARTRNPHSPANSGLFEQSTRIRVLKKLS